MEKDTQLQIELNEQVAEGTYANLAVIAHSTSEFVMDFVRMMPGVSKAKVKSRIIMTPEHAKRLLMALQDNIMKYEAQFGDISLHDRGGYMPGPMFKGEA
jgi:signal transduction protein with GAF and PtsI domain